MSNKIYLGDLLAELEVGEPSLPVSKVILNVDGETCYIAGDDTGSTIEQDCPWATQDMAQSVLAKLKGFVYTPFTGTDAILDPAAELGDAITVGGVYGIMAQMGRTFDRQATATVGAPGTDEIEDEYPYKSKQRKQTDRLLTQARSLISKTAKEIRLEVAEIDGRVATAELTLDGFVVTTTDEDGNTTFVSLADGVVTADAIAVGAITTEKLSTTDLEVNAAYITGKLSLDHVASISFSDLSDSDDIQKQIDEAGGLSEEEVLTKITSTLVSSPTIKGASYYDLNGLGKFTLAVNSDYGSVPWLKFEDTGNSVSLFEVVPINKNSSMVAMLLGGKTFATVNNGTISLGNAVSVTAAATFG